MRVKNAQILLDCISDISNNLNQNTILKIWEAPAVPLPSQAFSFSTDYEPLPLVKKTVKIK